VTAAPAVDEDQFARVPPNDIPAEQSVLGGMLLSKDAVGDVADILHDVDFYRPVHSTIFDCIVALYNKGEPADAVTVKAALIDSGDLGRIGGASYLHTLIDACPTAASAGYYARIVADRAVKRRLVEAGIHITQLGYSTGHDADDATDRAQQAVYDVTDRRGSEDYIALEHLLQPTMDEIEASGHRGDMTGIPTGFRDLDDLTNGLHPGQLVVIAGRPGLGKSTAALDIARSCTVKHKQGACIFTLEMSRTEVTMRLLSAEAHVPLQNLRTGRMSDDDWMRMSRRAGDVAEAPLFVDDSPNMTVMEIRAKARRLVQQHNVKLVIVDYMQLMSSPKRTESRQQEVSEISRGLKLMAKDLKIPVIAVSQLNRGPEQRTDKRPQLSDLRESGAIEQDADMVILLHRDDYYEKECPRAGEADFIVAKHRNGPTDTVTVAFQGAYSRFVDLAGPV
jgi:replicative DNA helicase